MADHTRQESTVAATQTQRRDQSNPKKLPPYHVVLLDDDDHSYGYVVELTAKLFGHPLEKGMTIAMEVDRQGRAILLTTTKEHAELKRDQIHAYGPDQFIAECAGSMTAIIEPAEDA